MNAAKHSWSFFVRYTMNKKTKTVLIIVIVIALCVIGYCGWYIFQYWHGHVLGDKLKENWKAIEVTADTQVETVEIPVDFEALWETNPEIYAWIYIPDTEINYPVLQHDGDNAYYLHRNEAGNYFSGGCIYSEDYNSKDFTDRMTVLYGHNLRSGKMFAGINDFADVNYFDEHRYMYVFLPDRELVYEIFAAYPHSNEHLLINHDFDNREEYEEFFEEALSTKSLQANFLEGVSPEFKNDKVLTLSTCFRRNNQQRYLLQGILVNEIPAK